MLNEVQTEIKKKKTVIFSEKTGEVTFGHLYWKQKKMKKRRKSKQRIE